jgi:hypothetical protein
LAARRGFRPRRAEYRLKYIFDYQNRSGVFLDRTVVFVGRAFCHIEAQDDVLRIGDEDQAGCVLNRQFHVSPIGKLARFKEAPLAALGNAGVLFGVVSDHLGRNTN